MEKAVSYIGTAEAAAAWHEKFGVHFFVARTQSMRNVANATAATLTIRQRPVSDFAIAVSDF